jgi:hypothetical protein
MLEQRVDVVVVLLEELEGVGSDSPIPNMGIPFSCG